MRQMEIEALRRQFPQTASAVYLNTGTVGLCPLPVVEALLEQTRAFELAGQLGWGPAEEAMNEARARLAARLTGWHIDIKKASDAARRPADSDQPAERSLELTADR